MSVHPPHPTRDDWPAAVPARGLARICRNSQVLSRRGNRLRFKHSEQRMNVAGAFTTHNADVVQWPCTDVAQNDPVIKTRSSSTDRRGQAA